MFEAICFAAGFAAAWFGKDRIVSAYNDAKALIAKVKGWL